MAGINPYVDQEPPQPATQKFTITFMPMNVTVEVDPEKIPSELRGFPAVFWILPSPMASISTTPAVGYAPARPAIASSAKASRLSMK